MSDVWVELTRSPISIDRAANWVARPDCGAVVVFGGTVRDHAEGRPGVSELEYEAYESQVEPRLAAIAGEARQRWPETGRVVIWHRTGKLAVGECSVVVAASAAHRGDAFEAARYCIDTVKESVPIWKRERWEGGEDWGLDAKDVTGVHRETGVRGKTGVGGTEGSGEFERSAVSGVTAVSEVGASGVGP